MGYLNLWDTRRQSSVYLNCFSALYLSRGLEICVGGGWQKHKRREVLATTSCAGLRREIQRRLIYSALRRAGAVNTPKCIRSIRRGMRGHIPESRHGRTICSWCIQFHNLRRRVARPGWVRDIALRRFFTVRVVPGAPKVRRRGLKFDAEFVGTTAVRAARPDDSAAHFQTCLRVLNPEFASRRPVNRREN